MTSFHEKTGIDIFNALQGNGWPGVDLESLPNVLASSSNYLQMCTIFTFGQHREKEKAKE